MATLKERVVASIRAFREPYLVADPADETEFASLEARQLRYSLYWAFYENTSYRHIHRWAKKYKADFGLYRYIRNIYNPAYRLGEFWKIFLMGGALDPAAGDGKEKPSALPIVTENQALRGAIGKPYKWNGQAEEWEVPYGFVPMVAIRHIDTGFTWSWSELHAARPS